MGGGGEGQKSSNYDEHLMSLEQIQLFMNKMYLQLQKHKDEKTGLKNWSLVEVWKLSTTELEKRLELIKTRDVDEIQKQCIHMANYLWFLWQKCIEIEENKIHE